MPGVRLVCAEAAGIAVTARPGQFVMVSCEHALVLRRPLSIHQVDNSGRLHLLFSIVGRGTSWLSQCQKGETLDLLGPLGNGFTIAPNSKNLLLIAGGVGIAPLMFLALQARSEGKLVTLLLGASTGAQLYPQELMPDGIRAIVTTEDGSSGRKGMVTDRLPDFVEWADQIYACGPKAMYEAIDAQRGRWSVRKPIQISLEVRMGCGLGACYGCSIKTRRGMKQVCQDGPVFDLEEILWEEIKI